MPPVCSGASGSSPTFEGSQREALLASEKAARLAAEQANRMKDEFLARISHELATPLLSMRMWLDVVGSGDERKREAGVNALRQCVQAQSVLIHDLLDTARALSGKLSVALEPCEPLPLVEAALTAIRPLANEKRITLALFVEEPPLVRADPPRLQQVVSNLLTNAVKFTPVEGRVEVHLGAERGGLSLRVCDTGRGFGTEFQPLLFTPFRQEEEGTTRSAGGLGLGLAIVRQLVELHEGKVRARSGGRGKGAVFEVWLPELEDVDEDAHRCGDAPNGALPLSGLRVLLVEDDSLARMAVAAVLEQQGARVEEAESAVAALRALGVSEFDLMLCDIAMPEEDGYSLIRKVRALSAPCRTIRAAAFTAHMREEDRARALAAGFQMHIPKYVEPAQLVSHVRALWREPQPV